MHVACTRPWPTIRKTAVEAGGITQAGPERNDGHWRKHDLEVANGRQQQGLATFPGMLDEAVDDALER
eukprot:4991107-Pyramimonas_sp.AAC.1